MKYRAIVTTEVEFESEESLRVAMNDLAEILARGHDAMSHGARNVMAKRIEIQPAPEEGEG